jgi:eukaryotic-like serine/threonine-protein kinase
MPGASSSAAPPKNKSRLSFDSGAFRYEVSRPLVSHPDYDTLLLAKRRPFEGGSPRTVILKPVDAPPGREGRARAREEVKLATHLHHPGIASVHGFAMHEGMPYVVSEHMRGCFLATAIEAGLLLDRKFSPSFAAYVAAEVADALDYAHRCEDGEGRPLHIVHRAVGPMRIRLGVNGRVKLTNFGSAWSELKGRLGTPPGLLRGDPAYITPEILRAFREPREGQADPLTPRGLDGRADIFSLGLVLLEMLIARYPLDPPHATQLGEAPGFPAEVRSERPTWISLGKLANRVLRFGPEEVTRACEEVPEPLRRIVARALRTNPTDRYPRASEMRDELRACLLELKRPYGAAEAAKELMSILEAASSRDQLDASSIERGILPTPEEKTRLH